MEDVYQRLAQRLDRLPNGFPSTPNGVEIKILKKIFKPEDAENALKLKATPETAEMVAKRLEKPVEETRSVLDRMAAKGQIGSFKVSGEQVYMLMPFVIGIYEFHVDHMDRELALLFREYSPFLMKTLGGYAPAFTRVVPVNKALSVKHQVLRYEDLRRMIDESRSFVLRECICRKQKALEGLPCKHPVETCLGFSSEEGAYDYFNYAGRIVTKTEAMEVLDLVEKEGLVHCTYNVEAGHRFVCNCCSCCCELLKSIMNKETPYVLAGSNFQATIDQDICDACGVCADERCMMDAIDQNNGSYIVKPERCIGCGVCTATCPVEAITLERRPVSDQNRPSANMIRWGLERKANRKADSKK